jgi:hypothetical protein
MAHLASPSHRVRQTTGDVNAWTARLCRAARAALLVALAAACAALAAPVHAQTNVVIVVPPAVTNDAVLSVVATNGTFGMRPDTVLQCANWIYAGSKSSVCFSPKFLATVGRDTNIRVEAAFTPVKLASRQTFQHPFAVMTGEGAFALQEEERRNLKEYLMRGGFLLASAGCSCKEWARSFQTEIKKAFPDRELKKIPMEHSLFRTLYAISTISLKRGGTTRLEGLEVNGRIVLVYTSEGLNDTANVEGCCCCGGNEIKNSHDINANIFAYAVMH